jgi:hypothetical protein
MLLLIEGQTGEAWDPPEKKAKLFQNRKALDKNTFTSSLKNNKRRLMPNTSNLYESGFVL